MRKWLFIAVIVALLAGTLLAFPTLWGRPVIGETTGQKARHWLACVFTASSALTGTGLTRYDLGHDFNRAGQIVILVLIQAGGLAVLVAGSLLGRRWVDSWHRQLNREQATQGGCARFVLAVCAFALLVEGAGAGVVYYLQDPAQLGPVDPVLNAVFLSISAFCNAGFTLTRGNLIGLRETWIPTGAILPLMVLGSIGAPAMGDFVRSLFRGREGQPLSPTSRLTLIGTLGLLVVGAGLLVAIERTPRWQLRNPRDDTPGRIMVGAEAEPDDDAMVFSSSDSETARSQRLGTIPTAQQAAAALLLSESARGGGFHSVRLDEQSIAPAGRIVMIGLMLVGGGLGGTTGGLYIVVVAVLLGVCCRRGQACQDQSPISHDTLAVNAAMSHLRIIRAAAAVVTGMFLIVGVTTLVLVYREGGSVEACLFEAVSACCSVGLSTGLTQRLSDEGQVTIVLAMLLGRILPLATLAGALRSMDTAEASPASAE